MKLRNFSAGIVCALLLLGCSRNEHARSGGIWDETENGVAIQIIDAQSQAVANARVRLIPLAQWSTQVLAQQSEVQDSGLTSTNGELLLHTSTWPAALEVETDSSIVRVMLFGPDSALQLALQKPSQLTGTLRTGGTLPTSVRLAGASWSSPVDAQGQFHFAKLPAGDFVLVAQHSTGLTYLTRTALAVADSTPLDTLDAMIGDSVVIEDFTDGGSASRYFPLTGQGWWYTFADSLSSVYPSTVADAIVSGNSAWMGGPSMHVNLAVDSTAPGKVAMVGCDLEASMYATDLSRSLHDLRSVDSITFWAKGSGDINLQFFAPIGTNTNHLIYAPFTLSSTWTRVTILPSEFLGGPYSADSSLRWDDLAPYMVGFAFEATMPADIWVDQITFHGITDTQLFSILTQP